MTAACRLCSTTTDESDGLCSRCKREHGRRLATLLARSLAEPSYATACLLSLPPAARERVARRLSVACLSAPQQPTREQRPGLRKAAPASNSKRIAC